MLTVSDREFEYLKLQRGDLDHLSHDFEQWLPAYRSALLQTLQNIKPYLPEKCNTLLDIGSGLGGIDILLNQHYREATGKKPEVYLLDGDSDVPERVIHNQPFNNRVLALGFQYRHGVNAQALIPEFLGQTKVGEFDLVVSFAAWGFHIPVKDYLDYVMDHTNRDTAFIVDARHSKGVEDFRKHFITQVIYRGKKCDRLSMRRR